MKEYLFLFRGGERQSMDPSAEGAQEHMQKWMQWMGELTQQGKFVGAQPLNASGKKITGNKKVPLLIYHTPSPVPDKATRSFSSRMAPEIYSAMAMIAPSALSRFIMTAVFAFQKPPVPMKSFTDAPAAKAWLKKQ